MGLTPELKRRDFSAAQLKLIRGSVARLCTSAEFDEFMAVAAQCGLDPLRRQIAPLIISPDDPQRRRLIPWTTIDGLRVIAARHQDYRPMERAPSIEYDKARIDEAKNPLGIVRAEVTAWKMSGGVWHAVAGEAWWDEFVPLRAQTSVGKALHEDGDGALVGQTALELDPAWRRMGRVMIAKCAEAQALRRGWPDLLSGLYGEEELHALRLADHTASEFLQAARQDEARKRKAARLLWFVAAPGAAFEPVPASEVESFVNAFYAKAVAASDIERFDADNCVSLATYWDWMPREAFRLKQASQTLRAALAQRNGEIAPAGPETGGAHGQV